MRLHSLLNILDKSTDKLRKPPAVGNINSDDVDPANVVNQYIEAKFKLLKSKDESQSQEKMFTPLSELECGSNFTPHPYIYNRLASEFETFFDNNSTDIAKFSTALNSFFSGNFLSRKRFEKGAKTIELLKNTSKLYTKIYSRLLMRKALQPGSESNYPFIVFLENISNTIESIESHYNFNMESKEKQSSVVNGSEKATSESKNMNSRCLPFNRVTFDIINALDKICAEYVAYKPFMQEIMKILKNAEDEAETVAFKYFSIGKINSQNNATSSDSNGASPSWAALYPFRKIARDLDFFLMSYVNSVIQNITQSAADPMIYPFYLVYKNLITLINFFDLLGSFTYYFGQENRELHISKYFARNLTKTMLSYFTGCFEYDKLGYNINISNRTGAYFKNYAIGMSQKPAWNYKYTDLYDPSKVILSENLVKQYRKAYRSNILEQDFIENLLWYFPINVINTGNNLLSYFDSIFKNVFNTNTDISIFDQIIQEFKYNSNEISLHLASSQLKEAFDSVLSRIKSQAGKVNLEDFKLADEIYKYRIFMDQQKKPFNISSFILTMSNAVKDKTKHQDFYKPFSYFSNWLSEFEHKVIFAVVIGLLLTNLVLLFKFMTTKK